MSCEQNNKAGNQTFTWIILLVLLLLALFMVDRFVDVKLLPFVFDGRPTAS